MEFKEKPQTFKAAKLLKERHHKVSFFYNTAKKTALYSKRRKAKEEVN
jgi:hypothetical protein